MTTRYIAHTVQQNAKTKNSEDFFTLNWVDNIWVSVYRYIVI